jgi:hypothetical protein
MPVFWKNTKHSSLGLLGGLMSHYTGTNGIVATTSRGAEPARCGSGAGHVHGRFKRRASGPNCARKSAFSDKYL